MTPITALFRCTEAYCSAKGLSEARVSTLIFNQGGRLKRVRMGSDIGARQIEKAMQWLSDRWPSDAMWPDGVERPTPSQTMTGDAA